jgi:hypothetical protein
LIVDKGVIAITVGAGSLTILKKVFEKLIKVKRQIYWIQNPFGLEANDKSHCESNVQVASR